jgi:iron complex transport system permease protein
VTHQERVRSTRAILLKGSLVAAVCLAVSLLLGRFPGPYVTPIGDVFKEGLARSVVLNLRLPRILAAFCLGMVLAGAGTVFQMIFRNPLVDAVILGVAPGAAFGASLGIVMLGGRPAVIQGCAAFFAFAGLAASAALARRIRLGDWVLRLVLAGIAVSALYTSAGGALKYLADPLRQLPEITFWMLGGLYGITWPDVIQILPIIVPCLIVLYLMRWRLNLLAMEDQAAFSLVSSHGRERLVVLFTSVAATAAVVSKAGQIGWVGLIVPHITRRMIGADARRALPASMIFGGCFVLVCDDVARTLMTGEIPLGIITSFIGAAVFLALLMMRSGLRVRRR